MMIVENTSCYAQAFAYSERMKTKAASQLTASDTIVRFGHSLRVVGVRTRTHPMPALQGREVVEVTHEAGVVNYVPNHQVQVA
jgi:uncharacterized transporter YbjL